MKSRIVYISNDILATAAELHLKSLSLIDDNETVEIVGYDNKDRMYVSVTKE